MSPSTLQAQPELDVLIIGGGPGGMSAALWASRLHLSALLVDRGSKLGGQLLDLYNPVSDYLGISVAQGRDLQPIFEAHLKEEGIPHRLGVEARLLEVDPPEVAIGDERISPQYVILATGARRRRLGLPSEAKFWKKGVSDSASRDLDMFKGKRVAVVGGGDAALENALNLSEVCPEVLVIVRRGSLRGRGTFQRKAFGTENIRFIWNSEIVEYQGGDWLESVTLNESGERRRLEVGGVCLRIGVEPNLELVERPLTLTDEGYVAVGPDQRSSAPAVFAIGDLTNPHYSSIAHSAGQGMVAAKAISLEMQKSRERERS